MDTSETPTLAKKYQKLLVPGEKSASDYVGGGGAGGGNGS